MTLQAAQSWYLEETVATATPGRLLCLLYDRLARDIGQARAALLAGRRDEADGQIEHELDAVEDAVASGADGVDLVADDLPTDLGPLPAELRPRAEALRARMTGLERVLVDAVQRSRRAVAFSGHPADGPRFLDHRG